MTNHDAFSETECAFIAQSIEGLTRSIQSQCLQQTKSYLELFTGNVEAYSPDFQPMMALFQQRYFRQDWRSEIDELRENLRQTNAVIISITSSDYPEQLKFISASPPLYSTMVKSRLPGISLSGTGLSAG